MRLLRLLSGLFAIFLARLIVLDAEFIQADQF